jgi:CRISP-associated protein Cas1
MEPYRPFVDHLVCKMMKQYSLSENSLDKNIKAELLSIPTIDVTIEGMKSPMMVAMQQSTASLNKCFEGSEKKIKYPVLAVE